MRQAKKKSKSSHSRQELERAAWEAVLREANKLEQDSIPDGWVNYDQFAEKMGFCKEVAALKLRRLARAGLCERKEFNVHWGSVVRKRPYFKIK